MSHPETSLPAYFTAQHRQADELWAEVENVAAQGAQAVSAAFERFDRSMRQHLALEEEVLFPAFEDATGMRQGPTMVMRAEHKQMRALLDQIKGVLAAGDVGGALEAGDTLLTLVQQHNMKEEGMLYRMSEQALAPQWPALRTRADAYR